MLIYNPAYDIYHCSYRILWALNVLEKKEYALGLIRIIDFYILFPQLASTITFPRGYTKLKKECKNLKTNYNDVQNPKRLYNDLSNIQINSLNYLASINLIDKNKIRENTVERTESLLPNEIEKLIADSSERQPYISSLIAALIEIPFNGPKGLKARSGLMEFRYDID